MTDEVRRRAACDRCHSQKIRCPRRVGSEICDRCMKARTPCFFSPFRQKKTSEEDAEEDVSVVATAPQSQVLAPEQHVDTAGLGRRKRKRLAPDPDPTTIAPEMISVEGPVQILNLDNDPLGLDWMPGSYSGSQDFSSDNAFNDFNFANTAQYPLDFSNAIPDEPDVFTVTNEVQYRRNINLDRSRRGTSNLLLGPNIGSPKPSPKVRGNLQYSWPHGVKANASDADSAQDFVRKLSQLNVDLSDHKTTLPPMSVHDELPPELDIACPQNEGYVLEDTFRLTQSLIEIYPSFLHLFINPTSTPSQTTTPESDWLGTDMFGNDGTSSPDSASSSTLSHAKQPMDHASILLLISCHLRVIDIYDILFKHMDVCIGQNGVAKTARQAALTAPTLSIGNYIPPPSSAVPMQMLLLVQFASQLYNFAVDMASEIPFPPNDTSSGGTIDSTLVLTKAAAENVKDRAGNMSQRLSSLRSKMLNSGLLA
ncbi:hypothetical protein BKA65DRAFT_476850 [Rhexocercosporidium sp. MPI-PUGE-AT-0058]|nr:hypothetical protein BKA65DRAFT_476850 [Rhexocercosporidium sp. MPI-PUGE-AT-0058]